MSFQTLVYMCCECSTKTSFLFTRSIRTVHQRNTYLAFDVFWYKGCSYQTPDQEVQCESPRLSAYVKRVWVSVYTHKCFMARTQSVITSQQCVRLCVPSHCSRWLLSLLSSTRHLSCASAPPATATTTATTTWVCWRRWCLVSRTPWNSCRDSYRFR